MVYRVVRTLVAAFIRIFNTWEIIGKENIPTAGPVVLVGNHVSQWDPPILACSVPRVVHFMAKAEIFEIPVIGKLWFLLQCFPVKRGRPDRNALKTAAQYLEKGEVLGLFPEGTRSKTATMLPFQQGAALFALRSQAPIIPVGLSGTRTTFPMSLRGHIIVRIGEPLVYQDLYGAKLTAEDLEKVTLDMQEKVEKLRHNP